MHVKYNKENNTLSNRLSTFKNWGYRFPNPSKMVWVELGKWNCFSDLGLQDAQVPQHDRKMVPRCSPRPSKLSKNPPQNHCHHHERCWSSGSCIQYLNHHHNHCHHRNRWDHPCHIWPIDCLLPTIRHSPSCISRFQTSSSRTPACISIHPPSQSFIHPFVHPCDHPCGGSSLHQPLIHPSPSVNSRNPA